MGTHGALPALPRSGRTGVPAASAAGVDPTTYPQCPTWISRLSSIDGRLRDSLSWNVHYTTSTQSPSAAPLHKHCSYKKSSDAWLGYENAHKKAKTCYRMLQFLDIGRPQSDRCPEQPVLDHSRSIRTNCQVVRAQAFAQDWCARACMPQSLP